MTTTAPRFAGLQNALSKISIRTADDRDRLRAAAEGKSYEGRLATTQRRTSAQPSPPAGKSAAAASQKPSAASAPQPPARKLERAEVVALAFRNDPKIKGMQDIALHMLDDPDLKGMSGDSIVKQLGKIDASSYRAIMTKEQDLARAARADATWSKAWGAIAQQRGVTDNAAKILHNQARFGRSTAGVREVRASQGDAFRTEKANQILANQRAFGCGKSPASAKTDSVWDRAYAVVASTKETHQ
ncbi:hypothetical protein [Sphingopyxis sp.]|uniref:hypothetical protein n=1 Tax=Sphingopyxis sp. TaxID=1908224 RepID=UPI001D9BC79D|nr:hypothetical protein [Sphingopyxis sp.]MBW8294742.1 hypothetical protein [Sphingopyxis sp.]